MITMNAKALYDFMNHFDIIREDVKIGTDELGIWFEKPSGEIFPVEYHLKLDGQYKIVMFQDNVYENGDGDHLLLEEGEMVQKEDKR